MENYFSLYQSCKNDCDFYHFKISINDYSDDGKCLLTEEQKKLFSVF